MFLEEFGAKPADNAGKYGSITGVMGIIQVMTIGKR